MRFMQGEASLVELTLDAESSLVGRRIGDVSLPANSALVAILREGRVVLPTADGTLEAGDEVLAVATTADVEGQLAALLGGTTESEGSLSGPGL
jgi:trk system potassium uptake protein TrkA